MPRIRRIQVVLAILLCIAALLALAFTFGGPPRVPDRLILSFKGTTNLAGVNTAIFTASNASRHELTFAPAQRQELHANVWDQNINFGPAPLYLPLRAGAARDFNVPIPAGDRAWRVPVVWVESPGAAFYIQEILAANLRSLRNGNGLQGLDIALKQMTNYTRTMVFDQPNDRPSIQRLP